MAVNSLLARVGLRLGTLGTAASLAIACPTAEGNVAQTAHTAATRTGFYFPTNESIGTVVNGAEAMRTWSNGGVQIGGAFNASPGAGTLLVSANAGASLPTVIAGVQVWLAGADASAVDTRIMLDAFSSTNNGSLTGRRARGTASTPTAVQASDVLLSVLGYGYGGASGGYSATSRGRIQIVTSQTWTDTVQGTQLQFSITPNGGVATYVAMVLGNDNSLTVGLAGSNKGSLVFPNASNTNTVSIAPGVTSASYSLTLPLAQAAVSGYVLSNDGTGVLSWAPPGAAGNLTGPITSVGLATSIASQTGTGTTFVVQTSPTLTTPTFQDSADPTKKLTFSLSGQSAGVTTTLSAGAQTGSHVFTLPAPGINDTLASLASTQTFTFVNTFSNATESISLATGAVRISGGLTVAKHIYAAGGFIDGSISSTSWATTGSLTIGANTLTTINSNTATIGAFTVNLPVSPTNGQIIKITSSGIVTVFTLSPGAGTTIQNAPTALAPGVGIEYILNGTVWTRFL